jgi:flagellar export protein FliJ
MAFRFPLETVLQVRESVEKREELVLQRIQQEIAQVQQQIDDLDRKIADVLSAKKKALEQPVTANTLQALLSELNVASAAKQSRTQALNALEQQRAHQIKIYQAAHSGRQMLTDMREKQKSAYDQDQDRKQQKSLDDIFASRLQRN